MKTIPIEMKFDEYQVTMVEPAGRGGICHYTYNLCCNLGKYRKVTLLTANDYELIDFKRDYTLYSILNKFQTKFICLAKSIRLLLRKNNVIHIQLSQYPAIVLLILFVLYIFKKKSVITAHNIVSHEGRALTFLIFSFIYNLSNAIIVHAKSNKEELIKRFKVSKKKIHIIPHGNYSFFNDENSYLDGQTKRNGKCILFFGYIRQYKGLMDLINAFPFVQKEIENVKLIIAGKPVDDFDIYYKQIKRLKITDNVELYLGYIPFKEIKKYFIRADVVAMPYKKIYQSGIIQLAYAFGTPVVATATGGLGEVVEDGKTGFIVPVGDVKKIAEKIITILRNRSLAKSMSDRAKKLSETIYAWENIAKRTTIVYDEVLS